MNIIYIVSPYIAECYKCNTSVSEWWGILQVGQKHLHYILYRYQSDNNIHVYMSSAYNDGLSHRDISPFILFMKTTTTLKLLVVLRILKDDVIWDIWQCIDHNNAVNGSCQYFVYNNVDNKIWRGTILTTFNMEVTCVIFDRNSVV